ncbi:flagellar hook-associated protein FlgK [Pseudomonas cavernicola]|uniref:Flagellar hook-associated protein 1 n=1 Tax=Pseudomonas cavernicola TaxID=2320866 RepID=A0A418XBN3_9PSED|nr:flagellar hook-associated protein FlgK [Pseudomonas cavernicola]RJG09867.1 flagellar hook-associated protein FlgK [Pseudomonas cavernicola]
MADLLNIGLSGLNSSKTSLTVTGHNISNVNTPGFSRQETVQGSRTPQFSGAGYIGAGSTINDVRRLASEFLTAQVRNNTVVNSDVAAYKSQIDQLDALLAGSVTGISPAMQKFFAALQASAEAPADAPARQLALSEAEGLAKRFNTVYERIDQQNQYLNKQMGAISDQVNRLATSVAQYNDAISVAKSNGKDPNDLLDAREETIRQLSTLIGVQVVQQDDSTANIFISSGQPLVVGSTANRIEVTPSKDDPLRSQVEFVSGGSRQTITSLISGGEIGGLIRYRSEALDPAFNSIGRLAMSISEQVNKQLKQGLDLKGDVGVNLFKDINSADLMAQRSFPTGLDVRIDDTSKLSTSDYEVEFVSSTQYRIRPVGGGFIESPPGTSTFTVGNTVPGLGFHIPAGGAHSAGESYLVMPTRRGAADIEKTLNQSDQLAYAGPVRATADTQNRGTGAIGQPDLISGPSPINTTDIQTLLGAGGLTMTFSAPDQLTISGAGTARFQPGNSSTFTITPGQTNTLSIGDGTYTFEMKLSGVPQAGDTYNVDFNKNGVSDNRNGLKLVDLQNKPVLSVDAAVPGSGLSFGDGYGELVERVGTLTAQSRVDSEATSVLLKQATDNRNSLSGVSLDEEAGKLIQFQQYYQASAQIIQTARALFDTLVSTFR